VSIYLLRHGFDTDECKSGWSDIGLDNIGIKQIEEVRDYLKQNKFKINKIVSSDLQRAKETADIIKTVFNLNVEYDPHFREFNAGLLSGMRYEDINQYYSQYRVGNINMKRPFPNGESPIEFYERIKECLTKLEDNTLYITHRLVIEVMYHLINNMEWDINHKRFAIEHGSLHEYDDKSIKKIK
jgi:probable phosphoglycerate mutase